jgi:hypothetical protein
VDTRPFNSPSFIDLSFQKRLVQILLGAISREIDEEETEMVEGMSKLAADG